MSPLDLKLNSTYMFNFMTSTFCGIVLDMKLERNKDRFTSDSYLIMKFQTGEVKLFTPLNEAGFYLYDNGNEDYLICDFYPCDEVIEVTNDDVNYAIELEKTRVSASKNTQMIKSVKTDNIFKEHIDAWRIRGWEKYFNKGTEYIIVNENNAACRAILTDYEIDSNDDIVATYNSYGNTIVVSLKKRPVGPTRIPAITQYQFIISINGETCKRKCVIGGETKDWEYARKAEVKERSSRKSKLNVKWHKEPHKKQVKESSETSISTEFGMDALREVLVNEVYVEIDGTYHLIKDFNRKLICVNGRYTMKDIISI